MTTLEKLRWICDQADATGACPSAVFVSDDAYRDVVEACGGVGGELRIHARCRTEPIPVRCCPALAAGAVVAVP